MKKYCIVPILMIFFVLPGCRKTTDSLDPVIKEIFPLKSGNLWIYQTTKSDSTRTTHVNSVINDTVIGSRVWHILTFDTVIRTICANTEAGWWFIYYPAPGSAGTPSLYYCYPAKVNDQYMTIDSTLVTVAGISEMITVPGGTFSCYHYHMVHYLENYVCEEYFAPGTGLIKHVVYESGSGTGRISEITNLISFRTSGK